MNDSNNKPRFYNEKDVKWDELAAINIFRDELERSGNLEKLLNGEKTDIISIRLMMLGVDVDLDATLQIIQQGETPIVEIVGIKPDYNSAY